MSSMNLRNLPVDEAKALSGLVTCRPGQVSSMSLVRGGLEAGVSMTLFAFAEGESVSEERYEGDTLYLCVEGAMRVTWPDGKAVSLATGEVLKVPAGVEHAVESNGGAFKTLQIMV